MESNRIPNETIYARVASGGACESDCVVAAMVGSYKGLDAQSLVRPGSPKGPSTVSPYAAMRSR